jgi:ubiquinone/menaquinone biosynthesis C-methylase UbiE
MARFVKEYYDGYVKNLDYEKERWFKDKASEEKYFETKKAILFHFGKKKFKDVLEIGCGPGTWSKILLKHTENLVLLDISKEMLKQAKKRLKNSKLQNLRIEYICSDFSDFDTKRKFDLIFSSRAIEYIPHIEEAIKKMKSLLKNKGKIIIITKNPARRWRNILLKTEIEDIHKGWIPIRRMQEILEKEGFKDIKIYPAVFSMFSFPNNFLVRKMNRLFYSCYYKKQIKKFIIPFLESYIIVGDKTL